MNTIDYDKFRSTEGDNNNSHCWETYMRRLSHCLPRENFYKNNKRKPPEDVNTSNSSHTDKQQYSSILRNENILSKAYNCLSNLKGIIDPIYIINGM